MKWSANGRRRITPLHVVGWMLAMTTVAVLWVSPLVAPRNMVAAQEEHGHAGAQAANGTVVVNFNPQNTAAAKDQIFTVDIQIVAGPQQVDGAEVHVDFDPLYLQVVDVAGNPVSEIQAGTALEPIPKLASIRAARVSKRFLPPRDAAPLPHGRGSDQLWDRFQRANSRRELEDARDAGASGRGTSHHSAPCPLGSLAPWTPFEPCTGET